MKLSNYFLLLILVLLTSCSHGPLKNCEEREGIFFDCEDV